MHRHLGGVEVGHELAQAAGKPELVRLAAALVLQGYGQTAVQVRQLAQALRQHLEAEFRDTPKNRGIRLERHLGAGLFRHADLVEARCGIAAPVLLVVDLAVALDLEL